MQRIAVISSTSEDLAAHRRVVAEACQRAGYLPRMMEQLPARAVSPTLVDREMVAEADVFLCLLGWRYGTVPTGARMSFTEMEFHHALERGLPILYFVAHAEHARPPGLGDESAEAQASLARLKAQARQGRVWKDFRNLEELQAAVLVALAAHAADADKAATLHPPGAIPVAPTPYLAHPYSLLQTSAVVGRKAELQTLTDWACAPERADQRVLSVVAIGGMGKSALTWKWFTQCAPTDLPDFAGSIWWSFYESDAHFENFLVRSLAYVSGETEEAVRALPFIQRQERLLTALDQRPFLLALDGLERLLLAYARMDAAQMLDEDLDAATAHSLDFEAGSLARPEAEREKERLRRATDPRAGAFLRRLLRLRCSRVLISTRLYPSELQAETGLPLPGSQVLPLLGLADLDALNLWRAFQLQGVASELLSLFNAFGNHPLVLRALAGEVAGFRPAPLDFDRWRELNPAFSPRQLNLRNVRTHILQFALGGLPADQSQSLQTLAAFRMPATWTTLCAVLVGSERPCRDEAELVQALAGLENRGLVGWDRKANRYDLHPVVRGIAWQSVGREQRRSIFQRLRDHFQALPEVDQYLQPRRLDELTPAVELCHSLAALEEFDQAHEIFADRLYFSLRHTLGANRPCAELLELFFPGGVQRPPSLSTPQKRSDVSKTLAVCYLHCGEPARSLRMMLPAPTAAPVVDQPGGPVEAFNLALVLRLVGRLYESEHLVRRILHFHLRPPEHPDPDLFEAYCWLDFGWILATRGEFDSADAALGASYTRLTGRGDFCGGGLSDVASAQIGLWCGDFEFAESRAKAAYEGVSYMHAAEQELLQALRVQGEAALGLQDVGRAEGILRDALARARSIAYLQEELPLSLALARLEAQRGNREAAQQFLEEIGATLERGPYPLWQADACNLQARMELARGETAGAVEAATHAYRHAWCDGPPYAYRAGLERAKKLLQELGAAEPALPPFAPAMFPPMPPVELEGSAAEPG